MTDSARVCGTRRQSSSVMKSWGSEEMWPFKKREKGDAHQHNWIYKGERWTKVVEETPYAVKRQYWQKYVCRDCGKEIERRFGYWLSVDTGSESEFGPFWSQEQSYWEAKT
jgi:hypothetical protein